jgi:phospholipid/cholesterol/gamma-HCH transport system substrate-binding protein
VASTLQNVDHTSKSLPELTREMQLLVSEGRELVAQVNRLSAEAQGAAGAVREDTLPRVNALAESVDRASQQVGRLALQLDREPQSAIFGRKPGRPGPGEAGFQ